jgi:hypothetical protein
MKNSARSRYFLIGTTVLLIQYSTFAIGPLDQAAGDAKPLSPAMNENLGAKRHRHA